jgi:hypothetical protein
LEIKKRDITINANEIQKIMREWFENLYLNKLEKVDFLVYSILAYQN